MGDPAIKEEEPSDEDLYLAMKEMLDGADLDSLSVKSIRASLEEKYGVKLKSRKDFIKESLTAIIQEGVKKEKKGKGGFGKTQMILSDELAAVLGVSEESRPQVVKRMWAYIKDNKLQDPNDGRKILLDDALQAVFGRETFTAFSMNRYLSAHLKKSHDDDFPEPKESDDEETKEAKKRARAKERKKSKNKKRKKRVVDPNKPKVLNAFTRPMNISDELSAFLGGQAQASRSEIVKKLWAYIKENSLQNPEDGRQINCDDTLKGLMKQDTITAFSMNKFIQPHIFKDEKK